jgi:XTP/dITP diphosphohydrolase
MARRLAAGPLVIATHNQGKLAELAAYLASLGIAWASAAERGLPEPEETGTTFATNARAKALAAAKATGLPALGDDSGLAVAALGGEPGIHSARWAGTPRDFRFAMERVEAALAERGADTPGDRGAEFVAALALAWPDGHVEAVEGRVAGTLVWPPRGDNGFGYDPMFVPRGHARTFGEMAPGEKAGRGNGALSLSHRARAFDVLARRCFDGS